MLNSTEHSKPFRYTQSLNATSAITDYLQTDELKISLKDIQQCLEEDSTLEQFQTCILSGDDFDIDLYVRREHWDAFEIQALSRELISQQTAVYLDVNSREH